MRLRLILLVSLGLNLGFGALLLIHSYQPREGRLSAMQRFERQKGLLQVKTNFVFRRQDFTWRQVESTDYRTYIANLRAIGCPEPTIRDIIAAEVGILYDRKRAEVIVPEQQWWRLEPNENVSSAAAAQFEHLEAERRALLADLLGPNWEPPSASEMIAFNLRLDGPILSSLPAKTKMALHDLEAHAMKRRQDYIEAQQKLGGAADPAQLERLRQDTRNELAEILAPPQLEEYLLRYSQTAQNIRSEFQSLEISPDEFRALFRARDALDQQVQLLASANDPTTNARRADLERQRDAATRQALGAERYQLHRYSQDPLFVQARASVEQIGAPADAVLALYQITQVTELEKLRIRSDNSLNLEQRASALANMLSRQQDSIRKILGEAGYQRYRQFNRE
jgi:hypothetical protein